MCACLCGFVCIHMCESLQWPEEGVRSPEPGGGSGSELSKADAGK